MSKVKKSQRYIRKVKLYGEAKQSMIMIRGLRKKNSPNKNFRQSLHVRYAYVRQVQYYLQGAENTIQGAENQWITSVAVNRTPAIQLATIRL